MRGCGGEMVGSGDVRDVAETHSGAEVLDSRAVVTGHVRAASARVAAGVVAGEVQALMALMRQNSKWAVPGPDDGRPPGELEEDPLMLAFKALRRECYGWRDWGAVAPVRYLAPFLHVIRSDETSGPITGLALQALLRFLTWRQQGPSWGGGGLLVSGALYDKGPQTSLGASDAVGLFGPDTPGAAEAMRRLARAVTRARFEATDPSSDEVVLLRILQVLQAGLSCPAGRLLSDDDAFSVCQTCLRVLRQRKHSELLRRSAQAVVVEVVRSLFNRLGELEPDKGPVGDVGASGDLQALGESAGAERELLTNISGESRSQGDVSNGASVQGAHSSEVEGVGTDAGDVVGPFTNGRGVQFLEPQPHTLEKMIEKADREDEKLGLSRAAGEESSPRAGADAANATGATPYGERCLVRVLTLICSLIIPKEGGTVGNRRTSDELYLFGLELAREAIEAGAASCAAAKLAREGGGGGQAGLVRGDEEGDAFNLRERPHLSAVVEDLVCRGLLHAIRTRHGNLQLLSAALSLGTTLYLRCRESLKLQLMAYWGVAYLTLAQGRSGASLEQQELCLESLVDLCRLPGFTADLYANFDCDPSSPDLFEGVCKVLSKNTFPTNGGPLSPINLLSLDGLLATMNGIATRFLGEDWRGQDTGDHGSVGETPVQARPPSTPSPASTVENQNNLLGGPAMPASEIWAEGWWKGHSAESFVAELRRRKTCKRHLAVAVEMFNQKPKKGVEYMQRVGLLPNGDAENPELIPEARPLACILRYSPGVSKDALGEFLGGHKPLNKETLKEFVATFDFSGISVDDGLRLMLESFRLPGEAHPIERIMEAFAMNSFNACPPGRFSGADTVFLLSYSLIMLNTDAHSAQVKKKMTLDQFLRNNRGIDGGQDVKQELMENYYRSITENEIKLEPAGVDPSLDGRFSEYQWVQLLKRNHASITVPFIPAGSAHAAEGSRAGESHASSSGSGSSSPDSTFPRSSQSILKFLASRNALEGLHDVEMFRALWGPAIASMIVIFDNCEQEDALRRALGGFHTVARIATACRMPEVLDNMIVSLCQFTNILNPQGEQPVVLFGADPKAQLAAVTLFELAATYGDFIRSGWRNILDCIFRFYKLGLLGRDAKRLGLPAAREGGSPPRTPEEEAQEIRRLAMQGRTLEKNQSVLSAFSRMLTIQDDSSAQDPTEEELASVRATRRCVADCGIYALLGNADRLSEASLTHLGRALIWSSGFVPDSTSRISSNSRQGSVDGAGTSSALGEAVSPGASVSPRSPGSMGSSSVAIPVYSTVENVEAATCSLDILVNLTVNCRRRLTVLWPLTRAHLSGIIAASTRLKGPRTKHIAAEAVMALLRLASVLVNSDTPQVSAEVLDTLKLILALDADVVIDFAAKMTEAITDLIRTSAPGFGKHNAAGWSTVLQIVQRTAVVPGAAAHGFNALRLVAGVDTAYVCPGNLRAAAMVAGTFATIHWNPKDERGQKQCIEATDMLTNLHTVSKAWIGLGPSESGGDAPISVDVDTARSVWSDYWAPLLQAVSGACLQEYIPLREHALNVLQRMLLTSDGVLISLSEYSEVLDKQDADDSTGGERAVPFCGDRPWDDVFRQVLLPLCDNLLNSVQSFRGRADALEEIERAQHGALRLLCNVFLQYLHWLTPMKGPLGFATLWELLLDHLTRLLSVARGEILQEAVPEALKNMLLVMIQAGALGGPGDELWELTKQQAKVIAPDLATSLMSGDAIAE